MSNSDLSEKLTEHFAKLARRFWWLRGALLALTLAQLVPDFVKLERYEYLLGIHLVIVAWSEIATRIGELIGRLPLLPSISPEAVNTAIYACFIVLPAAIAYSSSDLTLAFVTAFGIGTFIFGSMAGLYSFAPIIYPARIRTTGMGWAIGIGRFGAILASITAGVLLDQGWSPPHLYYAFALPLLVAIGTVFALHRNTGTVHTSFETIVPEAAHYPD